MVARRASGAMPLASAMAFSATLISGVFSNLGQDSERTLTPRARSQCRPWMSSTLAPSVQNGGPPMTMPRLPI